MDFEKKVPEWDNVGAEPDAQLKKEGFKAGYKPPAAYFNWFFNRISEVAKELQEKAGNEIDNKPDASGGDISDTVITSAEEPKDDYPVPAAGDSTKVFLGKTRKFFGDIKNWMTGVCLLGQIVNNCVTDNAKLPLSAAQGKALMDLYNVLNTNQQKLITNLDSRIFIGKKRYSPIDFSSLAAMIVALRDAGYFCGCFDTILFPEFSGEKWTYCIQFQRSYDANVIVVLAYKIYSKVIYQNYLTGENTWYFADWKRFE